jgi:hypothetical protein
VLNVEDCRQAVDVHLKKYREVTYKEEKELCDTPWNASEKMEFQEDGNHQGGLTAI